MELPRFEDLALSTDAPLDLLALALAAAFRPVDAARALATLDELRTPRAHHGRRRSPFRTSWARCKASLGTPSSSANAFCLGSGSCAVACGSFGQTGEDRVAPALRLTGDPIRQYDRSVSTQHARRRRQPDEPAERVELPTASEHVLLVLQRSAGNRAVADVLSRKRAAVLARSPAQDAIDANTDMFGTNLNEEALGAQLANALPGDTRLVLDVFALLDTDDSDDVALAIADAVPDDTELAAKLRPNPHIARFLVAMLQIGSTADDEAAAIERITKAGSADHERLANEPWNDSSAVQGALGTTGAELQKNTSGHGDLIFDEYSIVMDSMPSATTPEDYLQEMSNDLNAAVNSELFDAINTFHRRPQPGNTGGPAVGDVYHIDIKGPDNGSVMLVEAAPDHFVFQTVWTSEDGYHPEYGARQFGFERLSDGAIRWYTKGASRPGYTPGSGTVGRHAQEAGWTRLINGIADELQRRGGSIRSGSFDSWNTHRDDVLSSGRITL